MKAVAVEDLLGRIQWVNIGGNISCISRKEFLVTGGGGWIGGNLPPDCEYEPKQLIIFDVCTYDIEQERKRKALRIIWLSYN